VNRRAKRARIRFSKVGFIEEQRFADVFNEFWSCTKTTKEIKHVYVYDYERGAGYDLHLRVTIPNQGYSSSRKTEDAV
jgi:hypothetical protein